MSRTDSTVSEVWPRGMRTFRFYGVRPFPRSITIKHDLKKERRQHENRAANGVQIGPTPDTSGGAGC